MYEQMPRPSAATLNRRRKRRRKLRVRRFLFLLLVLALLAGAVFGGLRLASSFMKKQRLDNLGEIKVPDWVDVQLIDKGNARTGTLLSGINNIVIHYVGNPGTTAQNNRDYFAKDDTEVCSHFLVGLDGEIIQCVPLDEKSAASNWRNSDTISIEVCHKDEDGKFSQVTYDSLVKLTAWLCDNCHLSEKDVIRHYDITGKLCPIYYVNHEDAWNQLKKDIGEKLKQD